MNFFTQIFTIHKLMCMSCFIEHFTSFTVSLFITIAILFLLCRMLLLLLFVVVIFVFCAKHINFKLTVNAVICQCIHTIFKFSNDYFCADENEWSWVFQCYVNQTNYTVNGLCYITILYKLRTVASISGYWHKKFSICDFTVINAVISRYYKT